MLERDPISLNINAIKNQNTDKVVLVTGAAGSIGSEIVRQLINFNPKKIILLDQAESPLYEMEMELKDKLRDFDDEFDYELRVLNEKLTAKSKSRFWTL